MPYRGHKGRTSKIILYGYTQEVVDLRNQGLSLADISLTLNERHSGNDNVSKDCVARWLTSNSKSTYDDKPIEILEQLQDYFEDIYNELRKSSLPGQERHALIRFMQYRQNKLKSKFIISSNLSSGYSSESQRVTKILMDFSKCLCETCRKKVNEVLDK